MDKLEIKQGSFIQQTQYFIPVELDLSVVPARLGISDFFTCPIGKPWNTPKKFRVSLHNWKKFNFLVQNRDFSHKIPQKFSRLPPLGAPPPLTWNPGSAPEMYISLK